MTKFAVGVMSGVLAAFVAFVLNGWATRVISGFRIRKLLVTEIKETIRGLKDHYPQLDQIDHKLQESEPSFIWDGASRSAIPDHVNESIHHLRAFETSKCWRFYDALARLDVIRMEYNTSVRSFVTEEQQRPEFQKLATACLHDLSRHYKESISVGSEALLLFAENHWFLSIDVVQCDSDYKLYDTEVGPQQFKADPAYSCCP